MNDDIKFRLVEIVLICHLDYLIRHHLVNDDSSHNEIEHIQNYVRDVICDRGSLEWNIKVNLMFHGMWNAENEKNLKNLSVMS